MITQMVGLSETGLYNLACTVSNLMIIATDAINRSMCPYVYKSIKNKNILPVRKMTSSILLVVMVVSFLEMLIAPELIKIFATDDYLDAIYVIPPVAMSIYFIFLYVVFANVEFYFEKTIFAYNCVRNCSSYEYWKNLYIFKKNMVIMLLGILL